MVVPALAYLKREARYLQPLAMENKLRDDIAVWR